MISEVDIRDWQNKSEAGYQEYMRRHAVDQPYTNEVWTAACLWAWFEHKGKEHMIEVQQKIVNAVLQMQKGCPIKDFLSDEEVESALEMLADILVVTGIHPTEDE